MAFLVVQLAGFAVDVPGEVGKSLEAAIEGELGLKHLGQPDRSKTQSRTTPSH